MTQSDVREQSLFLNILTTANLSSRFTIDGDTIIGSGRDD